ncbi:SNF2-related protein [Virgibacillus salexigens]|uniref:Helicase C-terminal domain-containing protein n=1 Tax=Virgibacillus massiliensis TaxID=1462526 RepID=A0A024QIC4_9BACI|nr:SNF2-related protein [Virgibacillus massiliensis]CDQ41935.1 hypothetical protein BN990_04314 [Virgibacillus massiliensis]
MATFHSDEIYKLEVYNGRAGGDRDVFVDLLITSQARSKEIYLASISGSDNDVKQVSWLFQEGKKTGRFRRAEGNVFEDDHIKRNIFTHAKKNQYTEHKTKLGDVSQTLLVSKSINPKTKERQDWQMDEDRRNPTINRMIPDDLAELVIAWDGDVETQIYKVLNDRYGTPMIEEWKDFIVESLIDEGYYKPLEVYTFGIENPVEAGLIKVTERQLESIISEGITSYELDFALLEDPTQEDVLSGLNSIDDYLSHFAGDLAECIQENIELRFDPKKDKHHPAFKDVNLTANEHGLTGLFPPQADTVMGVANTLKEDNYAFVIGEMGAGKTPIGMVSPYLAQAVSSRDGSVKPYRSLVFSPSIMVEKWKREIKERIPNCEVHEISHWQDVLQLKNKPYRPTKIEYYVMNSDLPKYTYPMEPVKDWRYSNEDAKAYWSRYKEDMHLNGQTKMNRPKLRFKKDIIHNYVTGHDTATYKSTETAFHCPKCGGKLEEKKDTSAGPHFFEQRTGRKWATKIKKDTNYVCKNTVQTKYLPKEEIIDPSKREQECGFVLWQPEKLEAGSKKRKVSPAWAINKFLRRGFFKYLIADEVHEYKSGDSTTAQAFGQLINHTEKQILLTGTLMGGMASDIFYLLARLDPKRLLKESITYKDEALFTQRYGVFEKKSKNRENGRRQTSSNKKPGISPHLFPVYLMRNCAFLELSDLGYALPPYQEIPVFVEMHPQQARHYKKLEEELGNQMRSNAFLGGMKYVSTYINTMNQYSDLPFNFNDINSYDENGNSVTLATPYSFNPDEFNPPKFDRMLMDIDEELFNQEKKRKCLIYVKYTGSNSYNQADTYLYNKLKHLGYNVGILRSSGSYDGIKMPKRSKDREQWLKDQMKQHDWDILITNPKLVKVGLDLLDFPNIMYYQMDYSTYDYMQSSRRSWRIKQTEDVKVFTYSYRNSIQDQVLEHVATKIDAAMAMQGKFSEEGLRSMADSNDGVHSLAKKLLDEGTLDNVETIHERFQRLNQSYEELQTANYEDYDHYEVNPIEGGMETVKQIAQGLIKEFEEKVSSGTATVEDLAAYMEKFDEMMQVVDDAKAYNKGKKKKEKVVEGQVALALF